MVITPLASGFTHQPSSGEWHCHSLFTHAINLQSTDGDLLTLTRGAAVLLPMGWALRVADFDWLRDRLSPGIQFLMHDGALYHSHVQITTPARRIAPQLVQTAVPPTSIAPWLAFIEAPTGLCGPLNLAIMATDNHQQALMQILTDWANGDSTDIGSQIGLGPGLTPSMDDMLIGALSVLCCQPQMRARLQHTPLLPDLVVLTTLTTTVSACYLNLARQERFSSLVVHLLHRLTNRPDLVNASVDKLLSHGHTSGADTLLGLYVAQRWLASYPTGSMRYAG